MGGAISLIAVFSLQEILPCVFVASRLHYRDLLDFSKELRIILAVVLGWLLLSCLPAFKELLAIINLS
jgi:hypothetical protein